MKKTFPSVGLPQNEVEFARSVQNPPVPPEVLGCVQSILSNYLDREAWENVRRAILAPDHRASEVVPEQEDRLLSTEEMCEFLHASRPSIFRFMKAGKIRAYKLGRRNLFSLNEVLATLKNEEVANV